MIAGLLRNGGCLLLVLLALLNMGVVRRKTTAVQKTQQETISYKKQLEETKDGVKGAPTPSFRFYKKAEFLMDSPMKTSDEAPPGEESAGEFESTEVEEDAGWEEAEEEENEDWWVEEPGDGTAEESKVF